MRVGAELDRQAPVELLDDVQSDRVAQDPITMTVLRAPRRNLDRRPRPKPVERRGRLVAVAIDPHDAGALDQILPPSAATPARKHADKHIRPARQTSHRLNDA